MNVCAIVGGNWGDEGKGKATDYFAAQADVVMRFQGGDNAGHTVINDYGKHVFHMLPSGVFYPHVTNIIGPGVALNIHTYLEELEELINRGVPTPQVLVSNRAQVVLPFHRLLDQYEEDRLGIQRFGSTRRGISPFYSDKYSKLGIQVSDLFNEQRMRKQLERSLTIKNIVIEHLYHKPPVLIDDILPQLQQDSMKIKRYICDTTVYLQKVVTDGKRILLEGQLGALRDPDHGIYPYPTASSPLAGFATVGAGIPPYLIGRIIAVVKAYSSCVGAGPFVTEIFGNDAEELRNRGGDDGEYGATTGRPRRMGWFDVVATRYGCRVQGATEVYLSLLDVLGYRDEIPVCVAYEIDGCQIQDFPVPALLTHAVPIYEKFPSWKCDISDVRSFKDLPLNAKNYVNQIEEFLQVPIKWISVGPHRDATIKR